MLSEVGDHSTVSAFWSWSKLIGLGGDREPRGCREERSWSESGMTALNTVSSSSYSPSSRSVTRVAYSAFEAKTGASLPRTAVFQREERVNGWSPDLMPRKNVLNLEPRAMTSRADKATARTRARYPWVP